MRLKHLHLQGFKTFAPKTDLTFGEGLTAVVGPNGSGKSNVADAIRWVLGEQSLSHLRAKRTEDLIFAGSSNRAPLGMAEVSITLENSDRLLPLDFAEVTLTRRAYRSGENEYYLNKSRVRLRDILELASTLGQAYTVVGQGLIDAALSLRPEERRELFEEAAAIRGYFVQREDALRRLQKTEENVARVNDLVAELEPQVRRLERQARQTQEYSRLEEELHALQRLWYGGRWSQAVAALQSALTAEELALANVTERKVVVAAMSTRLSEVRAHVWELVAQVSRLHEERAQSQSRHAAEVQAQAVTTERFLAARQTRATLLQEEENIAVNRKSLTDRLDEIENEIAEHHGSVESLQGAGREVDAELSRLDAVIGESEADYNRQVSALDKLTRRENELQTAIANAERGVAEKERARTEAESSITGLQTRVSESEALLGIRHTALGSAQREVARTEHEHSTLTTTLAANRQQLTQAETARRDAIRQADSIAGQLSSLAGEQTAGLFGGVRAVVNAANQGRLNGYVGTVAELLNVPSDLEVAVEAALGGRLQDVVMERWPDAEAAIAHLKSTGAGRATFLPLDTIRSSQPMNPPKGPGIIGLARDLIDFDSRLATLADSLLGRLLIVEDLASARRTLSALQANSPWTLATTGGEVVRPGGSVTGGSNTRNDDRAAKGKTILARERRRRELQHTLDEARAAVTRAESAQERAVSTLRAAEASVQSSSASLDEARKRHASAQMQYMEQGSAVARLQQELSWRTGLLTESRREIEQLKNFASETRITLFTLRNELTPQRESVTEQFRSLAEMRARRTEVAQTTGESRTRLAVLAETLRNLHTRAAETRHELTRIEKRRTDLRSLIESGQSDEEQFQSKLRDHEVLAARLAELATGIESRIAPSEQNVRIAESEASALEGELSALQTALLESETAHSRTSVESQRCLGVLSSLHVEITEELGTGNSQPFDIDAPEVDSPTTSLSEAAAHTTPIQTIQRPTELGETEANVPSPEEAAERERRVYSLRSRLSRLGPVNPLAMEEHAALSERHTYLQTQLTDLIGAANSLRRVIEELDRTMRDQFAATFVQVNEAFSSFFTTLFGGGTARLDLTNPNDIASSGIEIFAQPPGKRLQPLAALSGGERALTSAALLFALLKVRPVPFCVLDEVDAALDESNVSRFRAALHELGSNTQFVVITHNRGTIEAADTLYGVSMAGDGTSQLLSLRVESRANAS
ncbi:MAG: chromosome segregation protein SMC [Chloroflexia bacterium]